MLMTYSPMIIFLLTAAAGIAAAAGVVLVIVEAVNILMIKDRRKTKKYYYLKRGLICIAPLAVIGLIFGAYRLRLAMYSSVTDKWRDGIMMSSGDDDRLLNEILTAADNDDRVKLAKLFSADTRGKKDFERELDAFMEAYPGGMSSIELTDCHFGLASGSGHTFDSGDYVGEEYREYGGSNGGNRYYIRVHYIDYCKTNKDLIGVYNLVIMSEGARAEFNLTGEKKEYSSLLCDMTYVDHDSIRIIGNDAFMWDSDGSEIRTADQVKEILDGCVDYDDMVAALGQPGASREMDSHLKYEYYYEIAAEGDSKRYVCINTDGARGGITSCYIYGQGDRTLGSLIEFRWPQT
ncbi:protein of unknown function [Ruminococcaceae bacterium YRB3002]|nr:protein of unknown function [Ruminococcaceae bacterium YRB3002]